MINQIKIISGGQSGVDRAALDFALQYKISCGGWCPKGRKAEDGRIHHKYPLVETKEEDYLIRTIKNIEDSEGVLILFESQVDEGTMLALSNAKSMQLPYLEINLLEKKSINLKKVKIWLSDNHISVVNIAGPRESKSPGIYQQTFEFLEFLNR